MFETNHDPISSQDIVHHLWFLTQIVTQSPLQFHMLKTDKIIPSRWWNSMEMLMGNLKGFHHGDADPQIRKLLQ